MRLITSTERLDQKDRFKTAPRPSDGISNSDKFFQSVDACKIRNGAGSRNFALPSALYSPILADLAHDLRHLDEIDPTPQVLDLAHAVLNNLINPCANENTRDLLLRDILRDTFLDIQGGHFKQRVGSKTGYKAEPDYFYPLALIYELKNLRCNGGDPTMQAVMDYVKLIADPKVCCCAFLILVDSYILQFDHFSRRSNCPCLSIGFSGTQIEVACFVYAQAVHFDSLFLENVRDGFDLHSQVLRLGRVFDVVLKAFVRLKAFYAGLNEIPDPAGDDIHRFFPNPIPLASTVHMPKFQFLRRLMIGEASLNLAPGVFIGIMKETAEDGSYQEGQQVVVKFSTRYNSDAQELLAKDGLAPVVYYSQRLRGCDFIMTIMEFVDGQMMSHFQGMEEKLPRELYTSVKCAIDLLHNADYVFGDLRPQNILVKGSSGVLVDFDWVARAGEGRYPASIDPRSVSHGWAPGMTRNGLMETEHDHYMLKAIEALCRQD